MDNVNIYIDDLLIDHLGATSDRRAVEAVQSPVGDHLAVPVIAEIRRAVSAALRTKPASPLPG